ncbi:RanBP1 domain-containing protein, partial [Helicosporidium sp. ATCC 50920]
YIMSDPKAETTSTDAAETKAPTSTPIFGSVSTFGTGGGFGGFAAGAAENSEADRAEDDDEGAEEEECRAEFEPTVKLEEVEVNTGEEDEDILFEANSKLYRFDHGEGAWKERGSGKAKLLKHKETLRIRFLFRDNKTLKIRGNHVTMPGTKVQEHSGNDKSMVWYCVDYSDEEQKMEQFCIRFASASRAVEFKSAYEAAARDMESLVGSPEKEKDTEAEKKEEEVDQLAGELEKGAKVDEAEA